uniref:hypothetical protein n=1 Tax=Acinetobacter baumannii TaxID=470 RepID=UPI0013D6B31B
DVQFLRIKPASLPAFLEQVGGRRERNASPGEEGCEEGCYYDGYSDTQRRLKGTVGGWVLDELRAMQDWYLRYQLTSAPGVDEVASVGGFVRQY